MVCSGSLSRLHGIPVLVDLVICGKNPLSNQIRRLNRSRTPPQRVGAAAFHNGGPKLLQAGGKLVLVVPAWHVLVLHGVAGFIPAHFMHFDVAAGIRVGTAGEGKSSREGDGQTKDE